ncbi:uncharacterized protein VTP21DRAFT_10616 [Calcarisporiella thermophila]|uniref:uncharacterized protein n=1 Tax=Calcarisporiella thermophila TaxID=911321 RepID=UPI00374468EF
MTKKEEKDSSKSRKPANTAFKQQRLKAWQPILTPKTMLPALFAIGLIFAPLGGLLLYASNRVTELEIDYTNCNKAGPNFTPIPPGSHSFNLSPNDTSLQPSYKFRTETSFLVGRNPNNRTVGRCTLRFTLPETLRAPVFVYYRLTNFYQNHRRYVKSLDVNQLKGESVPAASLQSGNCWPLATSSDGLPIYPCGMIANSLFNDTIGNFTLVSQSPNRTYVFSPKGIAWPSDASKFGKTQYSPAQCRPPPNWAPRYPDGKYTNEYPPPNINEDEHFQVWMRTAALPNFRKLYGRNDGESMSAGTYEVEIDMNFDMSSYGGSKAIILSTITFLGGRNPYLGIAYMVVGALCVLIALIFTVWHCVRPRKLGDPSYLSWNNPAKAAAMSNAHRRGWGLFRRKKQG